MDASVLPSKRILIVDSTSSDPWPGTATKESEGDELVDAAEEIQEELTDNEIHASACLDADREEWQMRLFKSDFAEGVDLSMVPPSKRLLVRPVPGNDWLLRSLRGEELSPDEVLDESEKPADRGEKRMSAKQLRSFIHEVYAAKRLEDRRRDAACEPRRQLTAFLQELLRRQHGLKKVVHQKSWQLIEALAMYGHADGTARMFVDFLDGSRELEELSFYLYCWMLLATAVPEETQATLAPSKPPIGCVSLARAHRLVNLLFADLPKALGVVRVDLEKCVSCGTTGQLTDSLQEPSDSRAAGVLIDDLCRVLLEGWRVSRLLLDRNVASFSWKECVDAFLKADTHCRGWLDPNEVMDAEARNKGSLGSTQLMDQTTLGAWVFRTVAKCNASPTLADPRSQAEHFNHLLVLKDKKAMKRAQNDACFRLSQVAFESLEKSLGIYISWLVHSDEPRDVAVYHAVKARVYGFRQASASSSVWSSVHNFRCLLILLLGHQFDVQLQRKEAKADHLAWEFTALLSVLRESWRRGAGGDSMEVSHGPQFGDELEQVGQDIA